MKATAIAAHFPTHDSMPRGAGDATHWGLGRTNRGRLRAGNNLPHALRASWCAGERRGVWLILPQANVACSAGRAPRRGRKRCARVQHQGRVSGRGLDLWCPGSEAEDNPGFPEESCLNPLGPPPFIHGRDARLCRFCRPPDADEKNLPTARWAKTAHGSA